MYILLILLLISLFLLNFSTKLMICSALFVVATLVVNLMIEYYNNKSKAIYGLMLCTAICCLLKWKNLDLMILTSYIAVLVSLILSIIIFEKLNYKLGFHIANFITLIIVSIIDNAVVCIGLLYRFSASKCLSIYVKDLIFKFSYASILSICLFIGAYLICFANKKYFKIST